MHTDQPLDPFSRPSGSQGGLGIGLAVARRLAMLHGGEMTARSAGPRQGSTFEVVLPRM